MLDGIGAAVAYYHGSLAFQQGTYQLFDVSAGVLVVGVRVDDYVSAQAQAGVNSCHKALCKTAVVHKADYVVHAEFLCALDGAVGAAVVYYKVFYLVDAVNMPGQVVDSYVKGLSFVIAGYLDN